MEEKNESTENSKILLEGIVQKGNEENTGRIYPDNFVGAHWESDTLDVNKSIEEATHDAGSELSVEEQQEILKQIIQDSKQKSGASYFTKFVKQKSVNADKKKKAKKRMSNKTRKLNRKK